MTDMTWTCTAWTAAMTLRALSVVHCARAVERPAPGALDELRAAGVQVST